MPCFSSRGARRSSEPKPSQLALTNLKLYAEYANLNLYASSSMPGMGKEEVAGLTALTLSLNSLTKP
jgi:hypothetical protein